MPLHIEQVAGYIKDFAVLNYPAALGNLYLEQDAQLSLTAPPVSQSYFVGEPDRYRPLECPALFVNPVRTKRFVPGAHHFGAALYQEHIIELIVLVEALNEEDLTRISWRHAQAVDALLNEFTLEPGAITQHSALAHVTDIDYGISYTQTHQEQRIFRKDVTLATLVQHWDQYTQLPLQTGSGAQITSVVGQANTGGVVSSVSEILLSTTNPTTIVSYGTAGGNYGVYIYLRITGATTLTVTVAWTDGSGAQSVAVVAGSQGTGSFMVSPFYLNAISGSGISVTATAGTASLVTISATVEALS